MLVNNFKGLITWGTDFIFKNVLGGNYTKTDILRTDNKRNGHIAVGELTYNYNTTTATNSIIDETALSSFSDIVDSYGSAYTGTSGCSGLLLFVGDGSADVTPEDYKLEKALSLAVLSASCTHTNGVTSVIRTFQNTTEEAVTVREVGLYVFKTTGGQQKYMVMVGRKLLDNPVTIEPNETYTFTYQITMNDFTFKEV